MRGLAPICIASGICSYCHLAHGKGSIDNELVSARWRTLQFAPTYCDHPRSYNHGSHGGILVLSSSTEYSQYRSVSGTSDLLVWLLVILSCKRIERFSFDDEQVASMTSSMIEPPRPKQAKAALRVARAWRLRAAWRAASARPASAPERLVVVRRPPGDRSWIGRMMPARATVRTGPGVVRRSGDGVRYRSLRTTTEIGVACTP